MWLECSFENSSAGIEMTGNDVPIVASSVFANCGRSVACGGNKALLNSVVRAGPDTQWALPSGGNVGFIEGCEVTADAAVNESATLFSPGKLPDARDPRSGASSMILMGNTVVRCPIQQLGTPACACWLELVPLTEVPVHAGGDARWGGSRWSTRAERCRASDTGCAMVPDQQSVRGPGD